MTIADLFDDLVPRTGGSPVLPGWDEVITPADEADLIGQIDASDLEPFRFQGWLGKRLTRSFGWIYDFANGRFEQGPPLPVWLLPTRDAVAKATGLDAASLVHALLIRYDVGAGIGWHKDRPVFEHVAGLSLGGEAAMRFRRRSANGFERFTAPLRPRSAYRLSGELRGSWEHSLAPAEVPRWSITFRTLRAAQGR
ncbi:MAG: alpha-ketoglutarate-dependent dioxygenase AlkB [Pseudomonadota bacterium]